jgi:hypothetical protein
VNRFAVFNCSWNSVHCCNWQSQFFHGSACMFSRLKNWAIDVWLGTIWVNKRGAVWVHKLFTTPLFTCAFYKCVSKYESEKCFLLQLINGLMIKRL